MKNIRALFIILIITISSLFFLFFLDDLLALYTEFYVRLPQVERQVTEFLTQEVGEEIFTPPPLRAKREVPESFLTRPGIIYWTNIKRKEYGLPELTESEELNQSAKLKVQDMIERQYFSHYSPDGKGVGDLVKEAGYEFILIGENLALGNFQNDEALVQAWMESQGHRENILNTKYKEIGVAVAKGMFEGKYTWFAVQHFGLPLSVCTEPDQELKNEIEKKQDEIEKMYNTLNELQKEIKSIKPKKGVEYNQKVKQYNDLVSQYNILIDTTESLIESYNSQVRLFNECITEIK